MAIRDQLVNEGKGINLDEDYRVQDLCRCFMIYFSVRTSGYIA